MVRIMKLNPFKKRKTTSKKSKPKTTSNKKSPSAKPKGKNKRKAKNEFRYNNSTSHPNYIFEESGKKYRALGLTHSDKTFGKPNMPLKSNPRKTDSKPAYIRNGIISEKKSNFSEKPIKGMSFGQEDFPNVKARIRNYKKNRRK